jgi:hypothetical protein
MMRLASTSRLKKDLGLEIRYLLCFLYCCPHIGHFNGEAKEDGQVGGLIRHLVEGCVLVLHSYFRA